MGNTPLHFIMQGNQQKLMILGEAWIFSTLTKALYLFRKFLIKVQNLFKKGNCTRIYILEYKELEKKINPLVFRNLALEISC